MIVLHFRRISPGNYISECKTYSIRCSSYPPEWSVYRRDEGGNLHLIGVRTLLCLAKTCAAEYESVKRSFDYVYLQH